MRDIESKQKRLMDFESSTGAAAADQIRKEQPSKSRAWKTSATTNSAISKKMLTINTKRKEP